MSPKDTTSRVEDLEKAEMVEAFGLYLDSCEQLSNAYERLESLWENWRRDLDELEEISKAYEESQKRLMSLLPKAKKDSLHRLLKNMPKNRRKAND